MLLLMLVLLSFTQLATAQEARIFAPKNDLNGLAAAAAQGDVRVIVGLNMTAHTGSSNSFNTLSEIDQSFFISAAQTNLLASLTGAGVTARNVRQYSAIPVMTMTVNASGLAALARSPLVSYIQQDGMNFISLDNSTTQVGAAGADGAWAKGYDGSGQTVAIIDTGVDKNHSFLAGKVVAEACYGTTDTFYDPYFGTINVVSNCPGGQDSTASNSGMPCNADGCYHGTHVAGIAAGKGDSFSGVAKGANLIAIKVFSSITNSDFCSYFGYATPCITAFDSDIIGALDRVFMLRGNFKIASVNMSLGGGMYSNQSQCNAENYGTKLIADKLRNVKIAVVVSSGNEGFNGYLSSPACISGVISVGAVTDFDVMPTFSNEASFLSLLAPGVGILSSVPGNAFNSVSGTSMAAPHVAGAWAVLRQFSPKASVTKLEKALKTTGPKVQGTVGQFPRIQINKAFAFLTKPDKATLLSPLDGDKISSAPMVFSWSATEDTTLYTLVVKNKAGDKVIKQLLPPESCVGDICSYVRNDPLPANGSYKWFVKTHNAYKENQSSKAVIAVEYPGAPMLQHPENNTVLTAKDDWTELTWSQVESATGYRVVVKDLKTKVKFVKFQLTTDACSEGICTYSISDEDRSKLRNNRTYKWSVQASNDYGKAQSSKFVFKTKF